MWRRLVDAVAPCVNHLKATLLRDFLGRMRRGLSVGSQAGAREGSRPKISAPGTPGETPGIVQGGITRWSSPTLENPSSKNLCHPESLSTRREQARRHGTTQPARQARTEHNPPGPKGSCAACAIHRHVGVRSAVCCVKTPAVSRTCRSGGHCAIRDWPRGE